MNEKIKELAVKAGFVGESMYPIFGTCQETALNNFSELIVNDVLNIVAISGEQCDCSTLFKKISEHFGVE